MDKEPLLSIITINYNNKAGLENTFKSIFNQTWQEFEYIVIDGGSTDGSKELIDQNQDKIDFWLSEPDKGVYNAMNKGIRVAKGKYLNFMNSGDSFYDASVLQKCTNYFDSGKSIYYGDFFDASREFIYKYKGDTSLRLFLYGNITHQASFIKRSLFLDYFLYNEDFKIMSDFEFYIRVIFQYNETVEHIPIVICNYEGGGLSSDDASNEMIVLRSNERKIVFDKYFSNYMEDFNYYDEAIYFIMQMRKTGLIQLLRFLGLLKKI